MYNKVAPECLLAEESSVSKLWCGVAVFGELRRSQTISPSTRVLKCFPVCLSDGGMKIKWVDNTRALGVFSSEAAGKIFDCAVNVLLGLWLKRG